MPAAECKRGGGMYPKFWLGGGTGRRGGWLFLAGLVFVQNCGLSFIFKPHVSEGPVEPRHKHVWFIPSPRRAKCLGSYDQCGGFHFAPHTPRSQRLTSLPHCVSGWRERSSGWSHSSIYNKHGGHWGVNSAGKAQDKVLIGQHLVEDAWGGCHPRRSMMLPVLRVHKVARCSSS